ncbi:MAG: toxin-antitoxin system, antitoxin component, Xre family protein [Candidatus Firestonebacteria bacterium]|nr:toxin-antitoxin system, antitoxin component, Xre family protein [Candidatus Firestonebacteria bacterium]
MLVRDIVKKEIDKLPDNLLFEVFDFIKFLEIKKEKDLFVKNAQELSNVSFAKVWDNEEDSIYDKL